MDKLQDVVVLAVSHPNCDQGAADTASRDIVNSSLAALSVEAEP
jgi:hypothetical protein